MKRVLLAAAILFHLVMLGSLLAHFAPGGEEGILRPVRRGARPVRGILPPGTPRAPEQARLFPERRYLEWKQQRMAARGLMALPARRTDSLGLDRWIRDTTRTDPGGDFFQIYASGVALRLGVSIFEEPTGEGDDDRIRQVRDSAPFHPPNRYPPVVAQTLGRALSRLRIWDAYGLWILLHEAFWVGMLFLGARLVPTEDRILVWAGGLGFLPWYAELYMGQTTFLVCASVVALAYFLRRARPGAAACAWAVGLGVKPLGLLLVPALLGALPLAWVLTGLLAPVLASLPYFVGRVEELRLFLGWAFGQELPPGTGSASVVNLLFHLLPLRATVPAVTVVVLLLSGLAALRTRAAREERIAFWLLTYFMIYAHVWEHHYILMVPVGILLLAARRRRLACALLVATGLPSLFWLLGDRMSWARETLYLLWKTVPVMGAYTVLLLPALRGRAP